MDVERSVTYSFCDINGELSPLSILEIAQDAYAETFRMMSCDNVTLRKKYGLMWVFTKNRVRAYARPEMGAKLFVSCNCISAGKVRCYILTEIKDEKGGLIADSLIESCLLDVNTFKITSTDAVKFEHGDVKPDGKIELPQDITVTASRTFTVQPTMIDYSRHFNNVQSLAVYLDAFPPEKHRELFPERYELVMLFRAQAKCGDKLVINHEISSVGHGYEVTTEDGTSIVKTHVKLK